MTQDDILEMFRQQARDLPSDTSVLNGAILELAQLLADSRGTLSKENFEALTRIGSAFYKNGHDKFHGKNDVDAIMKNSLGGCGNGDESV